jgi:hypothetical protein
MRTNHGSVFIALIALLCAGMAGNLLAEDTAVLVRSPSPPGASVAIANLEDGAVVPPTFLVQFSVTGMTIVPAGTDAKDSGHHHLLIDVVELPDPNLPLPMSDTIMHFGKGQTETELTLPEGTHTLQLVFADYRHIPHDPIVMSVPITITVAAPAADNQ